MLGAAACDNFVRFDRHSQWHRVSGLLAYAYAKEGSVSFLCFHCDRSSWLRRKFSQAERDGATFSRKRCFPLSLIGVKLMAA